MNWSKDRRKKQTLGLWESGQLAMHCFASRNWAGVGESWWWLQSKSSSSHLFLSSSSPRSTPEGSSSSVPVNALLFFKKNAQKETRRKLECDPQLDTGCKCGLGRRQDKCWQGAAEPGAEAARSRNRSQKEPGALRGILTSHWAGTKLEAGVVYFWPGEGSTEKEVGGQGQAARRWALLQFSQTLRHFILPLLTSSFS